MSVGFTAAPDSLDPALGDSVESWEANWNVYTPLLTYRHAEGQTGASLVPGLARTLPHISADGTTYSLRLRPDLRYSNGQPVVASDFEHSVKRLLYLSSPGAAFFQNILGAQAYLRAHQPNRDLPGIAADDHTGAITIRLTQPQGNFAYVLGLIFSAPLPSQTPFKKLNAAPPVGAGPYRYQSADPIHGLVLVRNPAFNVAGLPKGHIQQITVKVIGSQQTQAVEVLHNALDFMIDPPPADMLSRVRRQARQRYREVVTNSTYYWFMNTQLPPFNRAHVRQAVNYGIDKPALARLFGGLIQLSCNFLPPGILGYQRIQACPWGDPQAPPNLARARQLVRQAGARGAKVTVWGTNEDPSRALTQAYADQLDKMGFKTQVKLLSGEVYFQAMGNPHTGAQTGFADWFEDFPHPSDFFSLVDGATAFQVNNHNYGQVNDPLLNQRIAALSRVSDLRVAAPGWAALDKQLVSRAYVVPYGHLKLTSFMSQRMDFKRCNLFNPVFHQDFSSFCFK
jgi:peptide/nickel transport system substrate-binding protein